MFVLDYRCTVVNYVIDVTLHQLAVEVGDVRTKRTRGGTELLKHRLEGTFLTAVAGPIAIIDVGLELRGFLTGLTLAKQEEAVVSSVTTEYGADGVVITATDAQTVGQQLHGLDVVADVVDERCAISELP